MTIRAIATDLDGTLLRTDGSLSERTLAALRAAESRGVLVVVATARPPRWVRELVDQIGNRGVAVCANGALIYDSSVDEITRAHEISPDDAREIVRRLRRAFPELGLGVEQGLLGGRDPDYVPLRPGADDFRSAWIEAFLDRPTAKIFGMYRGVAPADLTDQVRRLVAGLADVTSSVDGTFVELMLPGVQKAKAVESVLVEHGIRAIEVVAFGDGLNDIELLEWAGRGIAVANAHPDVLRIADEITASNDEDGVAVVVERLLA